MDFGHAFLILNQNHWTANSSIVSSGDGEQTPVLMSARGEGAGMNWPWLYTTEERTATSNDKKDAMIYAASSPRMT